MFSEILIWYIAYALFGLAALPFTLSISKSLYDSGYALSKAVGLVITTYLTLIIGCVYRYDTVTVIASFLILASLSAGYIIYNKGFKINQKAFFETELIFAIAFFIFALVRAFSPEIYFTGGEKFGEFGFINAILRSQHLPPYDPYFGGEPIQYYYLGHLISANLLKLTGLVPEVGFNLQTAALFGMAAQITYSLGINLTKSRRYGIIAVIFVLILGNLAGIIQVLIQHISTPATLFYFDYWHASRIIPGTINEFPYFSFLHGDLHPHMIAIPFKILLLTLFFNMLLEKEIKHDSLIASGFVTGFLALLNTWDYPVFMALLLTVLWFGRYRIRESVLAVSMGIIPYLPFLLSTGGRGIGFVTERTDCLNFFIIHGLFLFILYSYIMMRLDTGTRNKLIALILILLPISYFAEFQLLFILLPLIIVPLWLRFKQSPHDDEDTFVDLLILFGALIALGCEILYVDDAFTGSLERMNTVFKLYLNVWIFWAVASLFSLKYLLQKITHKGVIRHTWVLVLVILILSASIYPVFATMGRSHAFKVKPTLDGLSWAREEFPSDMAAIQWLNENIEGNPVFLTVPARDYRWDSRVASITGLPIVIGWMGEEIMWREDREEVNARLSNVSKVLSSKEVDSDLMQILRHYNVRFIYLGPVERERYPEGILKFEDWGNLQTIYQNEGVVIYEVVDENV